MRNKILLRAKMLEKIRAFFSARDVIEVETPLLCSFSVTDAHLDSFQVKAKCVTHTPPPSRGSSAGSLFEIKMDPADKSWDNRDGPELAEIRFLQTSPEYAMKRMLAAGSGCIYQISKAFRDGETGRYHNPEFTMLEWYRLGFNHEQLLQEVLTLLTEVASAPPAVTLTYAQAFETFLDINPHQANLTILHDCLAHYHLQVDGVDFNDRDLCLQLLMTEVIERQFNANVPTVIIDFPASQAALARILPGNPPLAARFEVYWHGVELANGFYELSDVAEQRARFQADLAKREILGLPLVPVDAHLLASLAHGLPDCAGVALGIDRLVMCALGASNLADVISFSWERA
jgi:lysyl-tRNA synthetase class 2